MKKIAYLPIILFCFGVTIAAVALFLYKWDEVQLTPKIRDGAVHKNSDKVVNQQVFKWVPFQQASTTAFILVNGKIYFDGEKKPTTIDPSTFEIAVNEFGSSQYVRDKDFIYYFSRTSNKFEQPYIQKLPADRVSFTPLYFSSTMSIKDHYQQYIYAKDKDHFFNHDYILVATNTIPDYEHFSIVLEPNGFATCWGKDTTYVYELCPAGSYYARAEDVNKLVVVKNATALSFVGLGYGYAKDDHAVYADFTYENDETIYFNSTTTRIVAVDHTTFTPISSHYGKDKNYAYWNEEIITGAHPATFKKISDVSDEGMDSEFYSIPSSPVVAKDKYHVYVGGQVLPDADAKTFRRLTEENEIKFSNYFITKDKVYFISRLLDSVLVMEGADIFTFTVMTYGYAQDKNYYYYNGKRYRAIN